MAIEFWGQSDRPKLGPASNGLLQRMRFACPQQNAAMLLTVEAKQHGLFSLVNTWADPFFPFSTLW